MTVLRAPQLCNAVGISYRQLDYWTRTGIVTPTIAAAYGSGTVRRFGPTDQLAIAVIKTLLDNGTSLQSARQAADHIIANGPTPPQYLICDQHGWTALADDQELVDHLATARHITTIVAVATIDRHLNEAIDRLDQEERARYVQPEAALP